MCACVRARACVPACVCVRVYVCIWPGFKFSRASYLLSLLRPHIIKDLDLEVLNTLHVGVCMYVCNGVYVHAVKHAA